MAQRTTDDVAPPFLADEDGAVTVDWVVLTGLIVGLAVLAGQTMGTAITGGSEAVGTAMTDAVD